MDIRYTLGLSTSWRNEPLSINFILLVPVIELMFVVVVQVYCENAFLYMYVSLLILISSFRSRNVLYLAEKPLWNH